MCTTYTTGDHNKKSNSDSKFIGLRVVGFICTSGFCVDPVIPFFNWLLCTFLQGSMDVLLCIIKL